MTHICPPVSKEASKYITRFCQSVFRFFVLQDAVCEYGRRERSFHHQVAALRSRISPTSQLHVLERHVSVGLLYSGKWPDYFIHNALLAYVLRFVILYTEK